MVVFKLPSNSSPSRSSKPIRARNSRARIWGLVAIACYIVHASVHIARGNPDHLLWACHLASVAVGFGMLASCRWMTATGTLILMVGMPVWIFGLFTGGEFLPSSLLTHGVGLAIGMAGTVALGGVRSDAWKALAFVAILLVICRLVTRPEANVNLAFGQWQDLEPSMRFEVFILGLLAAWAVGLKLADLLFVIGVRRWTAQTR